MSTRELSGKAKLSFIAIGLIGSLAVWPLIAFLRPAEEPAQAGAVASPTVPVSLPGAARGPTFNEIEEGVFAPLRTAIKTTTIRAPEVPAIPAPEAIGAVKSAAVVPPSNQCDKLALPVRIPKKEWLLDDMEAKHSAALNRANQRLSAVQKCLREGKPHPPG